LLEFDHDFRRTRNLVVLVIADQALLNIEMRKQLQGLARIFARDQVGFSQDAQRAHGYVFEVSNRRRHNVKAAGSAFACSRFGHYV
jgi:hypothetical protein